MSLGFYSYVSATVAYGLFAVLLLFSWRASLQGKLLFAAMLVSTAWAAASTEIALQDERFLVAYAVLEIVRYIAWYVFLLKLFDTAGAGSETLSAGYRRFIHWALPVSVGFAALLVLNELFAGMLVYSGQFVLGITGNLVLSLISLAILEQIFRNMSPHYRWATKYLFLGAGGIFVFDFYMYADAVLFRVIDRDLWEIRGLVHLVSVPLLAIASARIKNWSLNIFVSRDIVLTTTALLAGGFYLLVMAIAGYYLREFGGTWGRIIQVMFVILSVVFLFALMSSYQLRAKVKVFLGKHFYRNKYDYRIEWLQLTDSLNEIGGKTDDFQIAIKAMANIVEAKAGQLWLQAENGQYKNVASWQCDNIDLSFHEDTPLIAFLSDKAYVVNIFELETRKDEYGDLELPECFSRLEQPWLIIPLLDAGNIIGFILLASPLVSRAINWEDRDLLKAAAKQVASHLVVLMTSAQLAEAKQFEVFSRLSAYMVHDLKNIAAELSMISRNAKKHMGNPEFIEDAFDTVEIAASDISRLLEQLRNRRAQNEKKVQLNLMELLQSAVESKQHQQPRPLLTGMSQDCQVTAAKERLRNVIIHLIDNAQQATDDNGRVSVSITKDEGFCYIAIEDTGHGMDESFIRERLFKAFDTTKGNAGMGIGMFESREFIRSLGGEVHVQSEPEKGTIITLQIPCNASSEAKLA